MSLQIKEVTKQYPEFNMNLSFSVEQGKLLTLLGPSGCGKTTTLHLIAGFISPDSGDIIIGSESVTARAPHERHIGVVFQDYALFPNLNVFGNIAFGLRMHGWERKKMELRVTELLELVHLSGYESRTVTNLSGGEQQRVALARALAPRPRLLLLDEPLSALDAKLRKELRSEIRRIQQEVHLTTVYVTHDQEEALALSDRIAVMNSGRIEQTGSPCEIYNEPQTLFVADFVGMSNRIYGKILKNSGIKHSESVLETITPEGKFKVRCLKKRALGPDVVLVFRPEKCILDRGPGDENRISGVISAFEYIGENTIITVQTKHGKYTAKLSSLNNGSRRSINQLHTGSAIRIFIGPEHIRLLSGGKVSG